MVNVNAGDIDTYFRKAGARHEAYVSCTDYGNIHFTETGLGDSEPVSRKLSGWEKEII